MSHLIESYALSCGLKIHKPEIYDIYFPIPFNKYLVIHSGGGMKAKIYEYYGEVVNLLRPIVSKYGYEIVQIGGRGDMPVPKTVNFLGATNIHQTAYVIKNASLLIGNDSCNVHIASSYDIPIVALYGSTTPYNHGPYFSSPEKLELIQADLGEDKPSYATDENPKKINSIKPEEVARKALKLLGINDEINHSTIFIGHQYNFHMLDLVPDCVVGPNNFKDQLISIRMDYLHNEKGLMQNLSMRKYRIITDKPFADNILKNFKPNIHSIIYDITKDSTTDFVEESIKNGIQTIMTSLLKGKDLSDAKLKFFDYGIIFERVHPAKEALEKNELLTPKTQYKTNTFLLGRDKIYLNKTRWQQDKSILDFSHNTDTVDLDDEEFLNHADNYYIFNE